MIYLFFNQNFLLKTNFLSFVYLLYIVFENLIYIRDFFKNNDQFFKFN